MISQFILKQNLIYNPENGIFIRKLSAGKYKKGDQAGSLNSVSGYVQIKISGKVYFAHRLAFLYMKGFIPNQVDHVNHLRCDNRWDNLRESNCVENSRNRSKSKNNKSGYNGVDFCKSSGLWRARLKRNKKDIHIGKFKTAVEAFSALEARKIAEGFDRNHGN